jgi:multiple sugar transport system permease protein/raffinose/stachyose/melibiose transport system permease protein
MRPSRPRAGRPVPWPLILGFLGPALLFYAVFTAYPVARTFYNSVFRIDALGAMQYVGLGNFRELFLDDATFWRAVLNTTIWGTVAPVIDVGLGLLLALCLYGRVPFSRFFRVAWFSPVLISYIVVGIVWMWIYNYDWGLLNALLRAAGLEAWTQVWLGNPRIALWALLLVDAWKWAGFNMVVCLAALHSLPGEVLEAAELDHCGWLAKLWFVMIPMLRLTLANLLILAVVGKMKVFDLVWITTRGGPLWSTETVSTYVYKRAFAWSSFDLGYPSAICVVWFVVIMAVVSGLNLLAGRRERLEY